MSVEIEKLGEQIVEKRKGDGVRKVAKEIGISPSTLSRVENGKMPDLETFSKICAWLGKDPSEYLGLGERHQEPVKISVHLRKEAASSTATAKSLAKLIEAAHKQLRARTTI